ncbi:MAG: helix-hairpin-helix domain-containing protein [Myxococcaceae bacterium]|nr:helix-hairpin-helix domain-containing protein [Myxococcaceae bacterium]
MVMLAALAVSAVLMGAAPAEAAPRKSSKVMQGVLNLNTATAAQLDQLPGVGPKAADRIIAHRSKTPFTRPEELVKVKGFGKKKLEKLKAHLAVSGPTTLKVLTSSGDASTPEPAPASSPAAQGRASSSSPKR